jgi:hypothetical protein
VKRVCVIDGQGGGIGVTTEPLPHLVQQLIQKNITEVLGCAKPTRTWQQAAGKTW